MIRQFSHLEVHLQNIEIEYYLMFSLHTLVSNLSILIIYQKCLLRTTVPLSTGGRGYPVDCLFVMFTTIGKSSGKTLSTLSTDVKKSRLLSKNKVDYLVIFIKNRVLLKIVQAS